MKFSKSIKEDSNLFSKLHLEEDRPSTGWENQMGLPVVSLNKVLLEHSYAIHLHVVCGCFDATIV